MTKYQTVVENEKKVLKKLMEILKRKGYQVNAVGTVEGQFTQIKGNDTFSEALDCLHQCDQEFIFVSNKDRPERKYLISLLYNSEHGLNVISDYPARLQDIWNEIKEYTDELAKELKK